MSEPITNVEDAVREYGALPMPVGGQPEQSPEDVVSEYAAVDFAKVMNPDAAAVVSRMRARFTAEINRLRVELAKYIGKEPTIAEEMAYLARCVHAVHDMCDTAEQQASRWEQPLPVPEWVAKVRAALEGVEPRRSYPPVLPWAALMDDEDLTEFLEDLVDAAESEPGHREALLAVEEACARHRLIAEAQHAHNTASGLDVEAGEPS